MKKILPRLALLAAPFLVYFALFFAFEPYDYFGVKGGASSEDSVITRVRAYLSAPEDAIIPFSASALKLPLYKSIQP